MNYFLKGVLTGNKKFFALAFYLAVCGVAFLDAHLRVPAVRSDLTEILAFLHHPGAARADVLELHPAAIAVPILEVRPVLRQDMGVDVDLHGGAVRPRRGL